MPSRELGTKFFARKWPEIFSKR